VDARYNKEIRHRELLLYALLFYLQVTISKFSLLLKTKLVTQTTEILRIDFNLFLKYVPKGTG